MRRRRRRSMPCGRCMARQHAFTAGSNDRPARCALRPASGWRLRVRRRPRTAWAPPGDSCS